MNAQPVLIVGTGAMACYFAARLSQAGNPVSMLGTWPEGLTALQKNGVHVVQPDGSESIFPVKVYTPGDTIPTFDIALVLVKSWQTERASRQLQSLLSEDGVALTLQNGLGNYESLTSALGEQRALAGVTTTGASLPAPGRVLPGGEGMISLGQHKEVDQYASLFAGGGFVVEIVPDLNALLWRKLVVNAAINPLTALLGVQNGMLSESGDLRILMAEIAGEVVQVAEAKSISLKLDDPPGAVEQVVQATASNRSSMLQDLERGAPTEIDAICGAIVRAGEQTGVPTPVNRTLWRMVRAAVEIKNKEYDGNR